MVGETGAGKTTLINTMVNYLLGVKFEDEEWYLIAEAEEVYTDQTNSQTSEINVYEVFVEENPTCFTIIDTPGYGHTEGYEKDKEVDEYLSKLFSAEDGIHYIDAVCFVMKASQNRLSGKELYIFHSVLSLFGRDIENNIVFLLTHSSGPPTDALNAIKKAEIPCRRDGRGRPVHFSFNNQQRAEREEEYEQSYRSSWDLGEKGMNAFLTLLEENNRKSVQMTFDVLIERKQLEACVSNLNERIVEEELKTQELTKIEEALRQNRDKIRKWRCHYSKHVKENRKYEAKTKEDQMSFDALKQEYEHSSDEPNANFDRKTYEDTKDEYEKTMKESEKETKMEKKMKSDLENIKKEKSNLVHEAYNSITSLSKIALKTDSAFTLQYMDFLIPRLREEGKDAWIKDLEDLKKAGEEQKNKGALKYVLELTGQKWSQFWSQNSNPNM
ncbi:hypothetical protein Q8A67_009593 [Cirrhinus molitorella]|uniref:AIG1-type G domain-containing protein n=1 Tax=Cirrhinus molitorella TaxID=172907 RepID=A0AA88PUS2_9TELE|nr:hypothetical protein Q8A67_009593 [Cirrhinus molitorella]